MYLYWYLPIISNLFETFCICPQEPKTTLISLIYRISDTGSQGCTDLQSLVTCLDHGDIVAQYAVMKGCVRCAMRWSASRRLYLQSWTVATLTWKLLSNICSVCCWILGQGWQLTAGHKHKHNACRAEIGGCVSGYTYISRVKQLWFLKKQPSIQFCRFCTYRNLLAKQLCAVPKLKLELDIYKELWYAGQIVCYIWMTRVWCAYACTNGQYLLTTLL